MGLECIYTQSCSNLGLQEVCAVTMVIHSKIMTCCYKLIKPMKILILILITLIMRLLM